MGQCWESLTGSWEQTQSLLCLHPAGLKQSLILAAQEFRDKRNFPTKGQQIQNVAGPELSPSNAAEECRVHLSQVKTWSLGSGVQEEHPRGDMDVLWLPGG